MKAIPLARHDLTSEGYTFGAIQTTRGCPLNCNFCSVTAFNGSGYRQRPILDVVQEFKTICEKLVLFVEDQPNATKGCFIFQSNLMPKEVTMGEKGKKDKGKREVQKKGQLTLKEKRLQKKEKVDKKSTLSNKQ
ncbi:MAG: hypothetical protein HOD92_18845 [Deltaproteobacteria bacterium]|nr:hypothetical protein [Deltaproteobacteria bacterium]